MAERALLIIDMLKDFIHPDGKLSIGEAGPKVEKSIGSILSNARREGLFVFYICDHHLPNDAEFAIFPQHCIAGSRGAEIVQSLAPVKGDGIIYKRRYSGFFATDLDISLRERGVDRLLLTGVCTNICVLYTAADARNLGYEVEVMEEGVASFSEEAHQWALKEMQETLGARVVGG